MMYEFGIDKVRGGIYCKYKLDSEEINLILK